MATTSAYCTFPEAAYALCFVKPRMHCSWTRFLQLVSSHAQGQDIVTGEVWTTLRDVAELLGGLSPGTVLAQLDDMIDAGVLRPVARGGSGISKFRIRHWTRWPREWWAEPFEVVAVRLFAFVATQVRARPQDCARVLLRAQSVLSREFSQQLENLCATQESRTTSEVVFRSGQVQAPALAHKTAALYFYSLDERPAADERGEGGRNWTKLDSTERQRRLLDAFVERMPVHPQLGVRAVFGMLLEQLLKIEATTGDEARFTAAIEAAGNPAGPWKFSQRLEAVREAAGPTLRVLGGQAAKKTPDGPRWMTPEEQRQSARRALELAGEEVPADLLGDTPGGYAS